MKKIWGSWQTKKTPDKNMIFVPFQNPALWAAKNDILDSVFPFFMADVYRLVIWREFLGCVTNFGWEISFLQDSQGIRGPWSKLLKQKHTVSAEGSLIRYLPSLQKGKALGYCDSPFPAWRKLVTTVGWELAALGMTRGCWKTYCWWKKQSCTAWYGEYP